MSRNLVNGDSLKKYHIGVNTPNISEELINENVTSFKVGTSNVNGTDLTNQMEQSLVDITYIEGNVIDRDWKFNPVVVNFDSGEKELYSLQDRFYDEYKDGKLHKRIRKLTNADFNIEDALCGSNAGWNVDGNTYGFYFQKCGSDCIDNTSVDCNLFRHNGELVNNDTPGIAISGEWGWIGFRVNKTTLGIISSDSNVQKLQKAKEWLRRTYVEVYYLVNETIINEPVTILANPNEEINVVSGTPTIIKHTIQLNTKSQVEETQKQIVKNNKSIWQRLKNLTDVEMKLENNGYIKLPTAFSGLKLQWGLERITANGVARDATKVVKYPIEFTQRVFFSHSNCYNSSWLTTNCTGEGLTETTLCVVNLDANALPQADFWLTWFAIGI